MSTLLQASQEFAAAVSLESTFPRRSLHVMRTACLIVVLISLLAAVYCSYTGEVRYARLFTGLSLIAGAAWLEQLLLFSYHNSFFFRGLHSVLNRAQQSEVAVTYDAAKIVLRNPKDITAAFLTSSFGRMTLLRAGLTPAYVDDYLATARPNISASEISLETTTIFTIIDLGTYLLSHDPSFANCLKKSGIPVEIFLGSLRWVIGNYHQEKRRMRWWGKDLLSQKKSIGQTWLYGATYLLDQYARNINTTALFSTVTTNPRYAEVKVAAIEAALTKTTNANVIVIGEAGVGKTDLIVAVANRIMTGGVLKSLLNQRLIVLDTNRLFIAHPEKAGLERAWLQLFDEAVLSGNIIIVIENLSSVIAEAEACGVFLPELLDEYLASTLVHVIATETPAGYHQTLETKAAFLRRFSEVLVETPDISTSVQLLTELALTTEARHGTLFTYGSLVAIAHAADRYLTKGAMPDKAIQLLETVGTAAERANVNLVEASFVYELVADSTGMPVGPVGTDERDLLLHLEDQLHTKVIGQSEAITAIARTMRRARAGVEATDKPLGSFLFLGPTGVGKTETAKALGEVLFKGTGHFGRFDMSEYSGIDALTRLIGDRNTSGLLPDLLKEHPYGILLLDEFEKAHRSVHDLFLQILDEGIFTDGRGTKVNARNCVIIATSNAGSQLIIDTVTQRKQLAHLHELILSHIITQGLFRPELLNRFDSTIIFEPLTLSEQESIARLLLNELAERVKEKGYELVVTDALLRTLVERGYTPEFGARPLRRLLQDVIEEKIATQIISGTAHLGDTITLDVTDVIFTDR